MDFSSGYRRRIKDAQIIVQFILLRITLLPAAGHIHNLMEQLGSNVLDGGVSGGNGACVYINQVLPLHLHVISGTHLDDRGNGQAVRSSSSCHEHLKSDAAGQLAGSADYVASRCGSVNQPLFGRFFRRRQYFHDGGGAGLGNGAHGLLHDVGEPALFVARSGVGAAVHLAVFQVMVIPFHLGCQLLPHFLADAALSQKVHAVPYLRHLGKQDRGAALYQHVRGIACAGVGRDAGKGNTQHNLRMAQDYNVQEAEELTRSVHAYGAKIFAQLHHGGATSKSAFTGRQNLSPSGVPMAPGGEVPREMTLEDIKRVQEKFIAAAIRCKKAGYDGVELHGAHSYLIAQFFSKYYNRRTDAYGGSLENRCRFIDEIIAGIRAKLGRYPISVRICGDEMTDEPGFLTLEDGLEIGRHLEAQGIDCINISNGSSWNGNANCEPFSYTPGWKKHVAKAFKEALSIPVIATNTIKDPDFAESLLEEGVSDFVALGRSQFADPEFMNKAKAGRPESIRKCIGCMYCRERLLGNAMPVECSLNPRLGREYRYRWQDLQKNGNSRPVVVVGGGPGGLECAVILAKRGFAVTLLEKEAALGGTLNIAKLPPHKANLQDVTDVLALEARELGVTVKLNTEATPETVAALHPVGVFLAAGAPPVVPKSIPGIDKAVLAEDVILGKAPCTGKVVLVGTGLTGLECAEMILEQGHSLAMVEMNPTVGQGIFGVVFNDIYSRIKPYDPEVYTSHRLTAVTDTGVTVEDMATGETKTIAADTVVLAMGTHSQEAMEASYRAAGLNAILVGSAEMPGRIAGATRDGFEKAWGFEAE